MAKWWWLDPGLVGYEQWSDEERTARILMGTVFLATFLILVWPAYLLGNFIADEHVHAFASFAVASVPPFFTPRWVARLIWPELQKSADENAARRINSSDQET